MRWEDMNVEQIGMWKAVFVTYFKGIAQYLLGSPEEEHENFCHGSYFQELFERGTSRSSLDGCSVILCYSSSNCMPHTCSDKPFKAQC
jgi:hypothetical protein